MTHPEAATLMGAVALRAASKTEQHRVRDHAASCAKCSAELARYDAVVVVLDDLQR